MFSRYLKVQNTQDGIRLKESEQLFLLNPETYSEKVTLRQLAYTLRQEMTLPLILDFSTK